MINQSGIPWTTISNKTFSAQVNLNVVMNVDFQISSFFALCLQLRFMKYQQADFIGRCLLVTYTYYSISQRAGSCVKRNCKINVCILFVVDPLYLCQSSDF